MLVVDTLLPATTSPSNDLVCCRVYRQVCKEVATVTETADGHWTSAGIDDEEVVVEEVPHPFYSAQGTLQTSDSHCTNDEMALKGGRRRDSSLILHQELDGRTRTISRMHDHPAICIRI